MKKYAFLPGALMIVGAVIWAAWTLQWSVPALVLGVGGLLALAVGIAANLKAIREWFADPRGIFAINSIVSTMLLVAILGLLNALVGFRAVTFDWTEAGRNTLTAGTRAILQSLGKDVRIVQYGRTHDPVTDGRLAAFAAVSPRIRTEFVDMDAAPQALKKYAVSRPGTVVIESGDRFRKVEKVTEPALSTAILQVTNATEPLVCFATGEGEHGLDDAGAQGLSGLAAVLTASNYKPDRVNLMQGEVPQLCTAIVVAGVPNGLSSDAVSRISRYIARGGRVALLLDPPVDPKLVEFLKPLGILVGQGVIIETSNAGRAVGAGPDNPIGLIYHEHPVTQSFEQRTLFGKAVPLSIIGTNVGTPRPLVSTGDTAFERIDLLSTSTEFTPGRDRRGPFVLAAANAIPRGSRDATLPEPRIVVTGDSDFLTNALLTLTPNRDLAVRIIAWLAGEEETHVVSVEERQNRRITMTQSRLTLMRLVNIGLLPLIPVLAGLVHFFRSRR